MEDGETPEQAVKRETKEELGIELKEVKWVGEFTNKGKAGTFKTYLFTGPLKDYNSELNEGAGMGLFSFEE